MRVFRDGEPVGVGFLVSMDIALTCAHVVGDVEVVDLDFPVLGTTARARVVHRRDDVDLVCLRLEATPPGAGPVRVVAVDDIRDHRVRSFGVPNHRPDGVWSQGVVRGPIASGRIHIEDDRAHGLPMLQGFSGGPVVDDELNAVVGMVVEVERRREHRIGYALSGAALHDAWPDLTSISDQRNPFRGLEPFQREDSEWFFGRTERTAELVTRLDHDNVLIVTGPSGCGKSSLVLAGMLPRLGDGVVVRPAAGGSPWAALAAALDVEEVTADRVEDVVNRQIVGHGLRRLTIVVDQFDEAQARFPDESADLLAVLLDVAESHHRTPRVNLVVTTTSEPLNRVLADPRFGSRLDGHTITLGTPNHNELREAIEGPLAVASMPVLERGLVDVLLEDLDGERNPSPLLEFTLTLLWERQHRGVLTHHAYRELGGVGGAVSTYAEQVWQRFDPDQTRHALTQSVSPLEGGGFTRRVVPSDELGTVVLELARTRLVTLGPDSAELVHEALVRHWDRLRDWVEADREFRLWQDELDRSATRWDATKDRALLPRGRAARHAWTLLLGRRADLTARQHRFIEAGIVGYAYRVMVRSLSIALVIGLTMALAYAAIISIGGQDSAQASNAAAILLGRADSRQPASWVGNTTRAWLTDDRLDTRSGLLALSRSLRHAEVVIPNRAVSSPAGSRIFRHGDDGRLTEVWDVATSSAAAIPVTGGGAAPQWLGEDRLVGRDPAGEIRVRDARTGEVVKTIQASADFLVADPLGHAFAYASLNRPEVHLVDVATGAVTTLTAPGPLGHARQAPPDVAVLLYVLPFGEVAVAKDGKLFGLSTAGSRELPATGFEQFTATGPVDSDCVDSTLISRDSITGAERARVKPERLLCTEEYDDATFSLDGRTWAITESTGWNGTETLFIGSTDTPGDMRTVHAHRGARVRTVERESSGAVRVLLELGNGVLVVRVPPPDALDRGLATARSAEVTPDGQHVVLLRADGSVSLWRIADRVRVAEIVGPPHESNGVEISSAVSPDSKTLAIRDGGTTRIRLWNLPDLAPLAEIHPPGPEPSERNGGQAQLSFPDPERLLVYRASRLSLWTARSGESLGEPVTLPNGVEQSWADMNEAELVMLGNDGLTRRYSIADGREVSGSVFRYGKAYGLSGPVAGRGGRLAVARVSAVDLFDLGTGELLDTLEISENVTVNGLRFHDDPDELDITLNDTANAVGLVQTWTHNRMWGIPKLLGRPDTTLENLPAPAESTRVDDRVDELEPVNPQQWLDMVCGVVWRSGLTLEHDSLPEGAFENDVC